MTTTEQIHEIVDHFGNKKKPELMLALKKLRKIIRTEVLKKLNKTMSEINETY